MRLGPITILRTKTLKAEWVRAVEHEKKREHSNQVRNKLVANLLHQNRGYAARIQRWGLSEGLIEQRTG